MQVTAALGWGPSDGANGAQTRAVPLSAVTKATVVDFMEARREEERAASTILNDLTAWSRVMAHAARRDWLDDNPVARVDREEVAGRRRQKLTPPTDVRPCGARAALSRGVKRGLTRTIELGRAAAMLADMPRKGRLFSGLPADSAVVSTRYGQWCRQWQTREERAAAAAGREPVALHRHRLHDLRHAFACASLVDDDSCIYRLSLHLGHTMVQTTEIYTDHLRKDAAMWR